MTTNIPPAPSVFPRDDELPAVLPAPQAWRGEVDGEQRRTIKPVPVVSEDDPWDNPNLDLAGIERKAAPNFPVALLGPFWSQWCGFRAKGASAPIDFVAISLLSCTGGAIANVRWPKAGSAWTEPPVIWTVAIGAPSSGKSPAVRVPLDLLQCAESRLAIGLDQEVRVNEAKRIAAAEHRAIWESQVKEAIKQGRDCPSMPPEAEEPSPVLRPRIRLGDTTIEAAAAVAADQPRGLVLFRDEVTGWIESYDRYKGGGDRSFWIEAFGGGAFPIDRKNSSKPIVISHLSIAATGGMQPDKLPVIYKGADDGLASRFLFAWPDEQPEFEIVRGEPDDDRLAKNSFARLTELVMQPGDDGPEPRKIPLMPEAIDALEEYARAMIVLAGGATGLYASSIGKARGQALRLSCILEHLWWCAEPDAPEPDRISVKAITAAIALMDGYFLPMAERVYGDASTSAAERGAAILALYFKRNRPREFNASSTRRKIGGPIKASSAMQAACDILVEEGLIRPAFTRMGDTPGRHAKNYEVNPLLIGGA